MARSNIAEPYLSSMIGKLVVLLTEDSVLFATSFGLTLAANACLRTANVKCRVGVYVRDLVTPFTYQAPAYVCALTRVAHSSNSKRKSRCISILRDYCYFCAVMGSRTVVHSWPTAMIS